MLSSPRILAKANAVFKTGSGVSNCNFERKSLTRAIRECSSASASIRMGCSAAVRAIDAFVSPDFGEGKRGVQNRVRSLQLQLRKEIVDARHPGMLLGISVNPDGVFGGRACDRCFRLPGFWRRQTRCSKPGPESPTATSKGNR